MPQRSVCNILNLGGSRSQGWLNHHCEPHELIVGFNGLSCILAIYSKPNFGQLLILAVQSQHNGGCHLFILLHKMELINVESYLLHYL